MDTKQSKIISMAALGIGSFVVGILPLCINRRNRTRSGGSLVRSSLLCFGGGVLLATSLLHMLPEAKKSLPQYADISFCGGFFMIYLVDEITHLLYGRTVDNFRNNGDSQTHSPENHHDHHHGVERNEFTPLLVGTEPVATGCHSVEREPCTRSSAGIGGLLAALSVHAVIEGLAIGIQQTSSKVLLLLGAVASHKLVVGFCLGTELTAVHAGNIFKKSLAIFVFSFGSALGIIIGMFIDDNSNDTTNVILGVMQGLAGGTLLYVTLSEVLPRERARWHHGFLMAGIFQFIATFLGFILMYFLNNYLDAEHKSDSNT